MPSEFLLVPENLETHFQNLKVQLWDQTTYHYNTELVETLKHLCVTLFHNEQLTSVSGFRNVVNSSPDLVEHREVQSERVFLQVLRHPAMAAGIDVTTRLFGGS